MSLSRRELAIWATFLLAFPVATQVTALAASGESDRETRPFVVHHDPVVQPADLPEAAR